MSDLVDRVTAYLAGGGLFNPELASHENVRDLLIGCRDTIATLTAGRDAALFAARNGKSLAEGALEEVRKICREVGSPVQAFIDDDVRCAIATLIAERDEARALIGRLQDHVISIRADTYWQDRAQAAEARAASLEDALRNIRKRCFDDSAWGRYIDRALAQETQP